MTQGKSMFLLAAIALVGCNGARPNMTTKQPSAVTKARPIVITATSQKDEYLPQEEVRIHINLNITQGFTGLDLRDYFHGYEALVRKPGGQTEALTSAGAELYGSLTDGSHQFVLVGPNYTETYDFPVSKLFDLSRPGQYTVEFFRSGVTLLGKDDPRFPIQFGGALRSNVATFRIANTK